MMRHFLLIVPLLVARTLAAQTPDTTDALPADTAVVADTVRDHARNRLLTMSTGETVKKGSAWFGVHEILLFQGGYAPTDFLQISAMVLPLPFSAAVGVKAQVLPGNGLFRGLSIGGDIGKIFYARGDLEDNVVGACNIATSFGNDIIAAHLNIAGVPRLAYPNLMQAGISFRFPDAPQTKLMAEGWFVHDGREGEPFEPTLRVVTAGIRVTNEHFVWELAGVLMSTESNEIAYLILPYGSAVWYF